MKAVALDHIDESSGRLSKSSLPKLTYNQALDLVVTLPGGAIRTVRSCSPDEMRAMVEASVLTAKNTKSCATAIAGLDHREMLDRWYCLLELQIHGCTLPLAEKQRQTARNAV